VNTPLRRSGMARSQGISQFYLHTPRSSANGMNHTCLCVPSRSWYSFTDTGGMRGWVGLGWLVARLHEYDYQHSVCMLVFQLRWLPEVSRGRVESGGIGSTFFYKFRLVVLGRVEKSSKFLIKIAFVFKMKYVLLFHFACHVYKTSYF